MTNTLAVVLFVTWLVWELYKMFMLPELQKPVNIFVTVLVALLIAIFLFMYVGSIHIP